MKRPKINGKEAGDGPFLKNASVAIVNAGARKFYLTKSRIQILLKHVTSVSFSTDASFC